MQGKKAVIDCHNYYPSVLHTFLKQIFAHPPGNRFHQFCRGFKLGLHTQDGDEQVKYTFGISIQSLNVGKMVLTYTNR